MIKVEIKIDETTQKITSIEVKGHSNKDTVGKDLVCAAVSAVLTGGMNMLTREQFDLELEEGYALIKSKKIPNDTDSVVLKTIETQLRTIEEAEKQFVKIRIL